LEVGGEWKWEAGEKIGDFLFGGEGTAGRCPDYARFKTAYENHENALEDGL
jgi:hypothetical protein